MLMDILGQINHLIDLGSYYILRSTLHNNVHTVYNVCIQCTMCIFCTRLSVHNV